MKTRKGGVLADLTYVIIGALIVIGIAYSSGFRYTSHANNVSGQPKGQTAKINQNIANQKSNPAQKTSLNKVPSGGEAAGQSNSDPDVSANTSVTNLSGNRTPSIVTTPVIKTNPSQTTINVNPVTKIVPMPPTTPPNCNICGYNRHNNPVRAGYIMCPLSTMSSAYACIL